MRTSAKRALVAAIAVVAFGALAGTASATMTWSGSAPWTASSGTVSLSGGLSSCDSSVLTLDNPVSLGAGLGGTGQVTDASFDSCELLGNSATVTASNLPWNLSVTPGSPDGMSVTGVRVSLQSGFVTCNYAGSLVADSWTGNDTATFTGASGLTRQSGSTPFLCPASPSFAGTYVLDGGVTVDPS